MPNRPLSYPGAGPYPGATSHPGAEPPSGPLSTASPGAAALQPCLRGGCGLAWCGRLCLSCSSPLPEAVGPAHSPPVTWCDTSSGPGPQGVLLSFWDARLCGEGPREMSFRKTGMSVPRRHPVQASFQAPFQACAPGWTLRGMECLNLGPRCSRAFSKVQGTQAEARGLV